MMKRQKVHRKMMSFVIQMFVGVSAVIAFHSCAGVDDFSNRQYADPGMNSGSFKVSVNSYSEANSFLKKKYIVFSGTTGVREADLEFKEYSSAIEKILNNQGMQRVSSHDSADVAVFLTYGVGNPEKIEYSYTVPTFGAKEIRSSSYGSSVSNRNGYSTFSGRANYYIDYGVVGYATEVRTETVFGKYLGLEAIDIGALKSERIMKQSWKITAVSIDKSNDLRWLFPVLALSLEPYLLTNSEQYVNFSIKKDDPKIERLREYIHSKREILLQEELEEKAKLLSGEK